MSKATQFKSSEMIEILEFHIDGNRKSVEEGRRKYAVNIVGTHGIGKTDIVRTVAKRLNMELVKINLAQLEELSDLVGFPITKMEVEKIGADGNHIAKWVTNKELDNLLLDGWKRTNSEPRMSYAVPEWIANRAGSGILLVDDWTRADNRFIQACMDLIYEGRYISWELPKDWHIVLTSNPDDGNYLVSSQDDAQKDRYFDYTMRFDVKDWAEWAENQNIDSRCINFMLMYPEASEGISNYNVTDKPKIVVSPRAWTMFFDVMRHVTDFNNNIGRIKEIGEGSVGTDASNLFCQFISQGFDKLMPPKDILFGSDFDAILKKLNEQLYSSKDGTRQFRADVGATIGTRLMNYTLYYLKDNPATPDMIDRLTRLITESVFQNDITFAIANKMIKNSGNKLNKLFANQKVMSYVLS